MVHGEAQLAGRWEDHGRQVVLDTCSVKVFLPGITDVTTLQAASTLCGQASWKVRGQDHATRHDVAAPDMIRQLPAGFALVIRGGCAPVIARLPRAWNNPAYRRARRRRPARPAPAQQIRLAAEPGPDIPDDTCRLALRCWCLVPVGPAMTADPLTAVLDQLAAYREQLAQLDDREAAHFAAVGEQLTQLAAVITTTGRTLADDTAALARLEALDRQVTELAARLAGPGADGKDRHQPGPPPAWWTLTPAERQASRSPGCGPGSSRCTGPATATWPPPSAPAGQPTTCACTGWTSPASCGERSTSSPPAASACSPPRPNTRPASCPPSLPS